MVVRITPGYINISSAIYQNNLGERRSQIGIGCKPYVATHRIKFYRVESCPKPCHIDVGADVHGQRRSAEWRAP